jgi:hypothetical protein
MAGVPPTADIGPTRRSLESFPVWTELNMSGMGVPSCITELELRAVCALLLPLGQSFALRRSAHESDKMDGNRPLTGMERA